MALKKKNLVINKRTSCVAATAPRVCHQGAQWGQQEQSAERRMVSGLEATRLREDHLAGMLE